LGIRTEDALSSGKRGLIMMRWGMPPPPKFGGAPVTNIRNMASPHWRGHSMSRSQKITSSCAGLSRASTSCLAAKAWMAVTYAKPRFAL
jgi:hypothetical protein